MNSVATALCLCTLGVCCAFAQPTPEGGQSSRVRTKVLFAFDMEDFIHPESANSVLALAKTLELEGVRGHFSTVAYFAKTLVDRKRFDVLDALKMHHIGTQTLYHSLHPNITEYTDIEDYASARERAMREECEGIGMIKAATGHERLWTSVLPGNGNTIVALYLYADLGIPFFCGGGGMYDDVTRCGDIWYCNQRHLTYAYEFRVEELTPGCPPVDIAEKLDKLSRRKVAVLFMHPCMLNCEEFWDGVNFDRGNLHEFGKWKLPKLRSKSDRDEFLRRYRDLVRTVKADPRFEIADAPALDAEKAPRRVITRDDVPTIRAALNEHFGPIRHPGEWCVADAFCAAIRFLRGEKTFAPGKVYGFLHEPQGVTSAVTVSVEDIKAAAGKVDLSGFLPAQIQVGGVKVGPADFLFAALEVLAGDAKVVKLVPREQIGDIRHYLPTMADAQFKDTWIYTPDYQDSWTSNRLRWQFWTFRYE